MTTIKRFLIFAILVSLLSLPLQCFALSFDSLDDLQEYLYYHAPVDAFGQTIKVTLTGIISDIYHVVDTGWEMIVTVPDSDAWGPLRYDDIPAFSAYFHLHSESVPFSIGDTVKVYGSLDTLSSSYLLPAILVKTINDSNDF